MQVAADQVWRINDMGRWHGKQQLGHDVSNHVFTLDMEPMGDDGIETWSVHDAADSGSEPKTFSIPVGCFERFVRNVDLAGGDDPSDWDE